MKIEMCRYLRVIACSSINIDEGVLMSVNELLNDDYVLASNPEVAPQIESVEALEKLLYGRGYKNEDDEIMLYYNRLDHKPMYSRPLSDIVFDMITDMLWDEPYEIYDADTEDADYEVVV